MKKLNSQNSRLLYPFILLYVLLFIYVFLRAYYLSFTHDESLSYFLVKAKSLADTLVVVEVGANNHLLNTFLMSISYKFFGSKEIYLRLHSVLSFLLYLHFCHLILRKSKNLYLMLFGAALLYLNPFLIEFFSLSRGYGISMACATACVYLFTRNDIKDYTYNTFFNDFILSVTFGALAVLSNLAAINFYIAVLLLYAIEYLLLVKMYFQIKLKEHILFIASFIVACIPIMFFIKKLFLVYQIDLSGQGYTSLLEFLISMINSSFYFSEYPIWVSSIIGYIILASFGIGFAIIIFNKGYFTTLFKIYALILIILFGFALENYLFFSKYPPERTCTILIVLIAIYLYQLAVDLYLRFRSEIKVVFLVFLLIIGATPITINFLSNLNLKYTLTWRYDAHTNDVMEKIKNLNMQILNKDKQFIISNNWIFEPAINYYIERKNISNMGHATRNEMNPNADYIYEFYDNNFDADNFEKIVEFKDIGTILYKNKKTNINCNYLNNLGNKSQINIGINNSFLKTSNNIRGIITLPLTSSSSIRIFTCRRPLGRY